MFKEIKSFFQCIPLWFKLRKLKKQQQKVMGSVYRPHPIYKYKKETNVLDVDLLDNVKNKDKKKVRQYTKVIVTTILLFGMIWITYSYILATISLIKFGNTNVLSDLSKQICVTILGVVVSYCIKAYFESYSEAKHNLDVAILNNEIVESMDVDMVNDDVGSVG